MGGCCKCGVIEVCGCGCVVVWKVKWEYLLIILREGCSVECSLVLNLDSSS